MNHVNLQPVGLCLSNRLIFALLILFHTSARAGDTLRFDIQLFGDSVGSSIVTREVRSDGSVSFSLESKSRAKILWIVRENYTRYDVLYRNGKLVSSKFIEKEKGEVKRWTNVSTDGKLYYVDSYKGKRTFTEPPDFSVVQLYFTELKRPRRMFFESEADYCQVEKTDEPGTWEFKTSDGARNIYHYKNGQAESLEVHVSIATVRIVRRK